MRSVYLAKIRELFSDTKDALLTEEAFFIKSRGKYRDGWLLTDGTFLDRFGLIINYRPQLRGHAGIAAHVLGLGCGDDLETAYDAMEVLLDDGQIRMTHHCGTSVLMYVRPTRPQYDFMSMLKATEEMWVETGRNNLHHEQYAKGTEGSIIVEDLKAVFR